MNQAHRPWLSYVPLPLVAVCMIVLGLTVDPAASFDPPWLILACNGLFITVTFLAVGVVALQSFAASGRVVLLLVGCGVIALGAGALAAALFRGLPGGANLTVTTHNTSALLGGILSFAASFLLLAGSQAEARREHRGGAIAAAAGGTLAAVAALAAAARLGWTPPFESADVLGFTPVRQAVLGAALALHAFSFAAAAAMHVRTRESFLSWYGAGLGMIALGLAAVFVQETVGSAMGWAGRLAQYLAGAWFLVALIDLRRSSSSRRTRLPTALAGALGGTEEAFRSLAENLPAAVRRFDTDGRHLYANAAALRLYPPGLRAVVGAEIGQVGLPEAQAAAWREKLAEVARTGERAAVDEEYVTAAGVRSCQSLCVPERDADGRVAGVLVVTHDVTDARHGEERLRETTQRLRAVLDAAPAIIWIAHDPECRSITGNKAAQVFSRVAPMTDMSKTGPRPELLSHYRVFQRGVELASSQMPLQRAAAAGQPVHECEVEFRFDNGEVRRLLGNVEPVLDSSGRPAGAIGAFIDITTQAWTQARLKDQYARQEVLSRVVAGLLGRSDPHAAVEALASRVMAVLDCQVFFNFLVVPGTRRIRLNAYAGIPAAEAARIEELEGAGSACGWVAQMGSPLVLEDIPRAGDPRIALVRSFGIRAYACYPLLSTGGSILGTLSFGTSTRDRFTVDELAYVKTVADHIAIAVERERSAAELARLASTLEQRVEERTREAARLNEQLRALAGELAQAEQRERQRIAVILHDNVQQLIVTARLLVDGIDPRDAPERTRAALASVQEVLAETLAASRTLTVEISPPILRQAGLVAALRWLAAGMAEKNRFSVQISLDPGAEPESEAARFLLYECARELLFNALKHSGRPGAALTLSRAGDRRIAVQVRDEGRGFDPAAVRAPGSGVTAFGLFSIEQRLAHLGGRLSIDAAPGRGTTVTIEVPSGAPSPAAAPAVAPVSGPAARDTRARDGAPIRVLVVDDNRSLRDGLAELLAMEGDIEVVGCAGTAAQALSLAESLRPDVVAMDLNLGGQDGRDVTRAILGRSPGVKVIGLSMYLEDDVAASMREAGAVAYVTKGGPARELADAIRTWGRQREPGA